ncbi:hypothetical protein BLNAU_6134 [Blattamonas nauphoetae]|uniref:Uncharacterized protein n=1 Tax=Blattamonas nauphoetae TaxID=2049346 RepID=A0ABQ9Y559_9EUKA|nr:hypothetical protein BLNAU_6134 [Blattamonas nauphoetae]
MDDTIYYKNHPETTSQSHVCDSDRMIVPEREPFLNCDPNSELSFEDKSRIYRSFVALVKGDFPFDDALQDRAALFLKTLESPYRASKQASKLVTDLVPSSAGSPSGIECGMP